MKLERARLCIDCEEIFSEATCPRCGKRNYEYVVKWIPSIKNNLQQNYEKFFLRMTRQAV